MSFWLVAIVTLVADQLSKLIVSQYLYLGQSLPVWPGVFHLTYTENPGAAFGILANQAPLFIAVTMLVAILVLIVHVVVPPQVRLVQFFSGLTLGGALGNALDRMRLGRVIDFIDLRIWPVFNLADIAIILGIGVLAWYFVNSAQEKAK